VDKFKLVEKLKPQGTLIFNKEDSKSYKFLKQKLEERSQKVSNLKIIEYSEVIL